MQGLIVRDFLSFTELLPFLSSKHFISDLIKEERIGLCFNISGGRDSIRMNFDRFVYAHSGDVHSYPRV